MSVHTDDVHIHIDVRLFVKTVRVIAGRDGEVEVVCFHAGRTCESLGSFSTRLPDGSRVHEPTSQLIHI